MWWAVTDRSSKLLPLNCMSKWQLFHLTSLSQISSTGSCRRFTKSLSSIMMSSHGSSSLWKSSVYLLPKSVGGGFLLASSPVLPGNLGYLQSPVLVTCPNYHSCADSVICFGGESFLFTLVLYDSRSLLFLFSPSRSLSTSFLWLVIDYYVWRTKAIIPSLCLTFCQFCFPCYFFFWAPLSRAIICAQILYT